MTTTEKLPSEPRSYNSAAREADGVTYFDFTGASSLDALVEEVEALNVNDLLVVRGQMRPTDYISPANHLKRGAVVSLPRDTGEAHGPTTLRQRVFEELPNGLYVGLTFMSPNNQEANRVLLTHSIEGVRRFRKSVVSKRKEDKIRISKLYGSKREGPEFGYTADVEVPSNSDTKKRYAFKVTGIPLTRKTQGRVWRRVATEGHTGGEKTGKRHSGCEHKYYGEITSRRPKINLWCPHEIQAYVGISSKVKRERGLTMVQPFPLPSEKVVAFDTSLRRNVFVQTETRNGRLSHRALHLNEKEMLHWGHVLLHKGENLFYATNRLNYSAW